MVVMEFGYCMIFGCRVGVVCIVVVVFFMMYLLYFCWLLGMFCCVRDVVVDIILYDFDFVVVVEELLLDVLLMCIDVLGFVVMGVLLGGVVWCVSRVVCILVVYVDVVLIRVEVGGFVIFVDDWDGGV